MKIYLLYVEDYDSGEGGNYYAPLDDEGFYLTREAAEARIAEFAEKERENYATYVAGVHRSNEAQEAAYEQRMRAHTLLVANGLPSIRPSDFPRYQSVPDPFDRWIRLRKSYAVEVLEAAPGQEN